jgi:hypothetical protein
MSEKDCNDFITVYAGGKGYKFKRTGIGENIDYIEGETYTWLSEPTKTGKTVRVYTSHITSAEVETGKTINF